MEERVEMLDAYLDSLLALGAFVVKNPTARKLFHLNPLLEKLGISSAKAAPPKVRGWLRPHMHLTVNLSHTPAIALLFPNLCRHRSVASRAQPPGPSAVS